MSRLRYVLRLAVLIPVLVCVLGVVDPLAAQRPWEYVVGYYGPRHWWRLGETSGTAAIDQTDAAHGTYQGGVSLGMPGAVPTDPDRSAYFNGINGRIELGTGVDFSGNHLTILCWIYPTNTGPGDRVIVGKVASNGNGLQDHWVSLMQRGTQAVFRLKAGGSTTEVVSNVSALAANQWNLVAGSYDGSSMSLIVLRSGTPLTSGGYKVGAINSNPGVPSAIASNPAGGQRFQGRIDEVIVFTRAISSADQLNFYSAITANQVFYVRPTGNDANTGTGPGTTQAWRTLQHALTHPSVGSTDVVYVHPGTYSAPTGISANGQAALPLFVRAVRDGSIPGWSAGDVVVAAGGSNALNLNYRTGHYWSGFKFQGNSASSTLQLSNASGHVFEQCEIYGGGHGIALASGSSAWLRNCLIRDNGAAGITCALGCTVTAEHCTIVQNGDDGFQNASPSSALRNSIVALNQGEGIATTAAFTHTHNIIYGNGGGNVAGTSLHATELNVNPYFADAASNDFRVAFNSAAIDAAPALFPRFNFDIDQVARPQGTAHDLGCYEYAAVGSWKFDEGSGTTAYDDSGNGNHGSLINGPVWTEARCGYALQFNGTSTWVDLGQPTLKGKSYTISAWFRTTATSDRVIVAATTPNTGNHHVLLQLRNGAIRYVHRDPPSSTGGSELISGAGYNDGRWHHVAAVKAVDNVYLYLDGVLVAQANNSSGTTTGVDFVIGKLSKSQDERYFEGLIDEVQIFGHSLSPFNIGQLYGLQGHWKLDESSGTIAEDSSPFGRDALLYSSPLWRPASGQIDGGLEFDGNDDYAEVMSSEEMNFSRALTIAAWVRIADSHENTYMRIVSKKPTWDAPAGYELEYNPALNRLTFGGAGANQLIAYEVNLGTGWHHVAVTLRPRDDGQVDGAFYIDGSLLNQALVIVDGMSRNRIDSYDCCPQTARPDMDLYPLMPGASPLTFGRSASPGTGDFFHGRLDDIRIYSRPLCDDELAEFQGSGPPRLRIKSWIEIK